MFSVSKRATLRLPVISLISGLALLLTATWAQAAPVIAPDFVGIYTLATFSGTPPGGATKPDDIAVSADGKNLWVGYGNGVATDGSDGKSSNAVEYDIGSGAVLLNVSIPGHMDGLKINPTTGDVWATENEDANPTLAVINHKNGKFKIFRFDPALITGGMDDLVFEGDKSKDVFIVTSSQSGPPFTGPVIVKIKGPLKKKNTELTSVQVGNPATVWNVVANEAEAGDMIGDPDSMTKDAAGELVLDNRSDDSLYIVRNPGALHPVLRVPLTLFDNPVEVNDTIFTFSETSGEASTAGTIFITDNGANKIYTLSKPYFPSNEVYTAADNTVDNPAGDVARVDLNTGVITPVVTNFVALRGLAFAPTSVEIAPGKE
jgi:hypothetical protein